MGLIDELDGEEDFREIVRSVHDPFRNHPALEWESNKSPINPTGAYENDVGAAAQLMLKIIEGEEEGGKEFYYNFKEMPGRIYLTTPNDPLLASGDVLAGNFGDPTYRNLADANPNSILTELEKKYQHILNKYSTGYAIPRRTKDVYENGREFGSVFSIEIPPDFDENEIERTAQAVVDASYELNDLAHQLIHSIQNYGNN